MHRSLPDGETRRVVGIEDAPPIGVNLMDVVAIPQWMRTVRAHDVGDLAPRQIRLPNVLAQAVSDIDTKSVDPAIGPEPHGAPEVLAHVVVLPVEIWLLGCETVEV